MDYNEGSDWENIASVVPGSGEKSEQKEKTVENYGWKVFQEASE